jgi:hypothetical protein
MSVTKRIFGDYNISTTLNPTANITLSTHTVYVNGNLFVGGTSTSVTKTELEITDNLIRLNKGETGAGVTLGVAGIEIDRGSSANVALRWNESIDTWQITNNGTTYSNIANSSGPGGLTAIIDDIAPTLGGNLNTLARSIFSSNVAAIKFDSNLAIKNTTITPTAIAGYDVVYAKTPDTGGSGLYVTNTTNQAQELATQRRNVVYSLVL